MLKRCLTLEYEHFFCEKDMEGATEGSRVLTTLEERYRGECRAWKSLTSALKYSFEVWLSAEVSPKVS